MSSSSEAQPARRTLSPRSLRWRLEAWFAFLLTALLVGFAVSLFELQRRSQLAQVDSELDARISSLSKVLRDLLPARFGPRGPGDPGRAGGRGPEKRDMYFGPEGGGRGDRPPGPSPEEGNRLHGESPRDGDPPGRKGPGPDFKGPPDGPRPLPRAGPPPKETPPDFKLPTEVAALFQNPAYYYVAWFRDGTVMGRSVSAPRDTPRPALNERDTLPHWRTRGSLREAFHCTDFGDCVLVGVSIDATMRGLRSLAWTLTGTGFAVLLLGFGGGWWFMGRAIRPLEEIGSAAGRISRGNLSERVPVPATEELQHLAQILNSTFGRLEAAFAQQRQFTDDAAHELRTPLAVIIAEAQATLSRDRGAGEYRRALEECLAAAQQMRRLIESLLALARFDAGENREQKQTIDLAETARECLDSMRSLAGEKNIDITEQFSSAVVYVAPERIAQVVTNLLANAIEYTSTNGHVRVETRSQDGSALLIVTDTGVGIDPEDLPHVFDRFYRADRARSSGGDHTGLGLAICKAIVDAEGGEISLTSSLGEGATATVRLPCTSAEERPIH